MELPTDEEAMERKQNEESGLASLVPWENKDIPDVVQETPKVMVEPTQKKDLVRLVAETVVGDQPEDVSASDD